MDTIGVVAESHVLDAMHARDDGYCYCTQCLRQQHEFLLDAMLRGWPVSRPIAEVTRRTLAQQYAEA